MLKQRANEADWLSGHAPYDVASTMLKAVTDRRIKYYACLREPKSQVMSHLNWLIEIGHRPKEFFYGHPIHIQEMSFEIRANGLKDKLSILYILTKYRKMFLNFQSRVVMGQRAACDVGVINKVLSEYEFVGNNSELDTLLRKMGIAPEHYEVRENASEYHFDTSLFDDEEVDYFLKVHNAVDELLYRTVCAAFVE